MKVRFYFLGFLLFLSMGFSQPSESEILINNRILATVNGKTISVLDVMKKMDVYLSGAYPDQPLSTDQKYKFFSQSWRGVFNQMVNNELILADAESLQMKIPDAKIREILHQRFGPNIMASLDEFGITFDEAWKMIYTEIAVQQATWYRVYKKARDYIGPQDIKMAYQDYIAKTPPKEEWKYQVLSIRAKTETLSNLYAQKAQALMRNEPLPFDTLAKKLLEEGNHDPSISISVSDEYNVESKDLSDSHREVLSQLHPGSYSQLVSQISRTQQGTVHRIFYLKDRIKTELPSLHVMMEKLEDELLQKKVDAEYPVYLSKLRKQFNLDDSLSIPEDFQPFSFR